MECVSQGGVLSEEGPDPLEQLLLHTVGDQRCQGNEEGGEPCETPYGKVSSTNQHATGCVQSSDTHVTQTSDGGQEGRLKTSSSDALNVNSMRTKRCSNA